MDKELINQAKKVPHTQYMDIYYLVEKAKDEETKGILKMIACEKRLLEELKS